MSRASRLLIAVALLSSVLPFTAAQSAERTYEVTITNLTKGQPLSPPVVVVHDAAFRLFAVGTPASEELAAVAEDANVGPLLTLLDGEPAVRGFAVFDGGPVLPGASATVEVTASGALGVVSALGMLVTTNDAFFA
ncbi:MAG: spondin domain-containing protein, partial [Acidobacteriota bacterium]